MKTLIFLVATLALVSATEVVVKPESKAYLQFTYQQGSTAAYPVGTGIIYSPRANVLFTAGASVTYVYPTTVTFAADTEFYTQSPTSTSSTVASTVLAGTNVTFPAKVQVAYGPGTLVIYNSGGETRYEQFNMNTHAIASYPLTTSVQYYYGSNGNNLILFPAGTNPLVYYNPGGNTQFGASALPVEKNPQLTPQIKTYGSYGGGGGYSYCGGYSYNGYPRTNYYNSNTGYQSSCSQTCYNCYSYSNQGSYNMGSNYGGGGGGGAYYGTGGGGAYYGTGGTGGSYGK